MGHIGTGSLHNGTAEHIWTGSLHNETVGQSGTGSLHNSDWSLQGNVTAVSEESDSKIHVLNMLRFICVLI